MAINKGTVEVDEFDTVNDTRHEEQPQSFEQVFTQEADTNIAVIGLSNTDLLISPFNDSEILNTFADASKKALSETKVDIDIFKIDKDKFDLGYSCVLYAHKAANNKVYYFIALLEKSGREPVTVKQILDDLNVKHNTTILVTSDAFDGYLHKVVTKVLNKAYGDVEQNSLQGAVVPYTADAEVTSTILSKHVHDVIAVSMTIDSGSGRDVSIKDIVAAARNGMFSLDVAFNTGLTVNKLGRNVRSDFNVEVSITKNGGVRSLHGNGGRKKLNTVSGYLEYIIGEEANNYTQEIKRVAEPMFILNEFIGAAPTINYALLSIINAATFTNKSLLKNIIIEKDAGPLNYLFNYKGETGKLGEKISFKDAGSSPEVITDIIRTHIKSSPMFALEIEVYGSDYSYMNEFALLSNPETMGYANEVILDAAEKLFGKRLNTQRVYINEGLIVPIGEFVDGDGNVRDIREIDTAFVCQYANEPSLVYNWIYSNLPIGQCQDATGKDPYTLKLEVIGKLSNILNIKPIITGRAARVPLNGEFVNELVTVAMASGYTPRNESSIMSYVDNNNLQNVVLAYSGATVGNLGFGVQTAYTGYGIPTVNAYR